MASTPSQKRVSIDWLALLRTYLLGDMDWRTLSREKSGDLTRPKYDTLKRRVEKEGWEGLRSHYWETGTVDFPGLNLPPKQVSGGALIDKATVAQLQTELSVSALIPKLAIPHFMDDLPDEIKERSEQYARDPDLMAMRPDIATLQGLIGYAIQRMGTGESADNWKKVKALADDFLKFQESNPMKASQILTDMFKIIAKGNPIVELQKEVVDLIEKKVKVIEADAARTHKLQEATPRQDVINSFRQIGEVIREEMTWLIEASTTPEERTRAEDVLRKMGNRIRKLKVV